MLAEEEECLGNKAMWWWQGGGSAGSNGGDMTNVWSSCPVHRVPDPLPPGQQQPQHVNNGGGGDHGEALHSSQTDTGVGMHLQAFGQNETPLGAATGGTVITTGKSHKTQVPSDCCGAVGRRAGLKGEP